MANPDHLVTFRDLWPLLSSRELQSRLETSDFAAATLLLPENIVRLCKIAGLEDWRKWLREPPDIQRSNVAELILRVGFSDRVAAAISRVERHHFVPEKFKKLAQINASLPLQQGVWTTTWGMSAILLQQLVGLDPERVVDAGFGAGCQAVSIMSLFRHKPRLAAYEPCVSVETGEPASRLFDSIGSYLCRAPFDVQMLRSGDCLIVSYAMSPAKIEELKNALPVDATAFAPRHLTEQEFLTLPAKLRWRGAIIDDYQLYLTDVRAAMIWTSVTRDSSRALQQRDFCGGIYFVMEAAKPFGGEMASMGPALSTLHETLDWSAAD